MYVILCVDTELLRVTLRESEGISWDVELGEVGGKISTAAAIASHARATAAGCVSRRSASFFGDLAVKPTIGSPKNEIPESFFGLPVARRDSGCVLLRTVDLPMLVLPMLV